MKKVRILTHNCLISLLFFVILRDDHNHWVETADDLNHCVETADSTTFGCMPNSVQIQDDIGEQFNYVCYVILSR